MAGLGPVLDEGGDGGELHDRLCDPAAGIGTQPLAQGVELARGRRGADHDALAAGAVHGLDHELREPVEHLGEGVGLLEPPGVDVAEDRLLVEVVAHEVRDVGVGELVVGDAVAEGVGEHDIAGEHRPDEARHAEHRVGTEHLGIEEVVVGALVDHVDATQPGGGAHVDAVAPLDEIGGLHEVDAHGAGEQRVLEVGAVVAAGGEDHDGGLLAGGVRGGGLQRGEQPARVLAHAAHGPVGEQLGEALRHGAAVGEHVAHAAGGAHVVLEHAEAAVPVAHQVDAGHVQAHAVRGPVAAHRIDDIARGGHELLGDHAVGDRTPVAVDVVQEGLQGLHPLGDARGDLRPLLGVDHARDRVDREGTLLPRVVEGDALVEIAAGE